LKTSNLILFVPPVSESSYHSLDSS